MSRTCDPVESILRHQMLKKLDRLSLQKKLDEIGKTKDVAMPETTA